MPHEHPPLYIWPGVEDFTVVLGTYCAACETCSREGARVAREAAPAECLSLPLFRQLAQQKERQHLRVSKAAKLGVLVPRNVLTVTTP